MPVDGGKSESPSVYSASMYAPHVEVPPLYAQIICLSAALKEVHDAELALEPGL